MKSFIINIYIAILMFLAFFYVAYKKGIFKDQKISDDIPNDFIKIYEEIPEEIIVQLGKKRKNIILSYIVATLIVIVSVLFVFVYANLEETIDSEPIGIFYLFFISIIGLSTMHFNNQYRNFYKEEIIGRLVKYINPKYRYILNDKLERKKLHDIANKCVNINKRIIKENDRIEGETSSGIFYIMNVNEKYQRITKIEKRILVSANLSKDINTKIEIIPSKRNIFECGQEKLNNFSYRSFYEKFDVYSENENIIPSVLTTDIMDLIVDFYDRNNIEFKIIYENDKIYFYFEIGELFEPKLYGDIVNFKNIYFYKLLIKLVIEVVENSNKIIKTMII